ncbi:hypothetical protein JCM8097_003825 [Rhodosporidiobolus ruineniae]
MESAASSSSYRTVLFPLGTTWPSPADFYSSCNSRLLETYGLRTHKNAGKVIQIVASCQKDTSRGCRFRVAAAKNEGEGDWQLCEEDCRWQHTHGPGDEVGAASALNESAQVRAVPTSKKRRRRSSSASGSSSDARNDRGDGSAGESDESEVVVGRVDSGNAGTTTLPRSTLLSHVQQPPTPNLPQPGQTFQSFKQFYQAAIRAIVPAYGMGLSEYNLSSRGGAVKCYRYNKLDKGAVRCPFELVVRFVGASGKCIVDRSLSVYEHNHGPAPEILANPSWRPNIKNDDAREALGLPLFKRGSVTKQGKPGKERGEPVRTAKKGEGRELHRSTPRLSKPPSSHRKPRDSLPRPASSSRESQHYWPAEPAPHRPPHVPPAPFSSSSRHSFSAGTPHYPPTPSFSSSSSPAQPVFAPPPLLFKPSIPIPLSLTHLTAFLTSLHPSLSSLAPTLLPAGIDSVEALTAFALFDEGALMALLETLRGEGGTGVGVVQAGLLVKGLKGMAGGV